jgi:DNA-binding transcriptional LysR family regulator
MLPTPHATALVEPLRQALELLRVATQQQVVFDPATSSRRFRISMTDISHLQFLPALMQRVGKLAPGIHIEMLRITAETPRLLEAGESDLAVGFMPELEAGFYQQKPFDQGFACAVRKNHPRIEARMTLNLYKRERHVAITAVGSGHDQVESALQRLNIDRQVALSLPTLPGLGNLLAKTDLVATVSDGVAQMLVGIANVKALTPPFSLPGFAIKQHWHERYQHDPANRWLRSVIAELLPDACTSGDVAFHP